MRGYRDKRPWLQLPRLLRTQHAATAAAAGQRLPPPAAAAGGCPSRNRKARDGRSPCSWTPCSGPTSAPSLIRGARLRRLCRLWAHAKHCDSQSELRHTALRPLTEIARASPPTTALPSLLARRRSLSVPCVFECRHLHSLTQLRVCVCCSPEPNPTPPSLANSCAGPHPRQSPAPAPPVQ